MKVLPEAVAGDPERLARFETLLEEAREKPAPDALRLLNIVSKITHHNE